MKRIHLHLGKPTVDEKWTGVFTAKTKAGKSISVEGTVEAPDAYVAGDKLRALAEKKFGTDLYYPVIRFNRNNRLPSSSISNRVARQAGPEEDKATADSLRFGPFSRNRSVEEIKKDIERTKLGLSGVRGARRLGYQEELADLISELEEAEERKKKTTDMAARLTLKSIASAAMARMPDVAKLELVRGNGYFYVVGEFKKKRNGQPIPITSGGIYTNRLGSDEGKFGLDFWVREVIDVVEKEKPSDYNELK